MVLELSGAEFDIVGMNGNVTIWVSHPEIPQVGEEVGHDSAEGTIELGPILGGCHKIDGNGAFGGPFGCIENESTFLSILDKVVLWLRYM